MKKYFKNFILLLISFLVGIETIGFITSNENALDTQIILGTTILNMRNDILHIWWEIVLLVQII